MAFATVKRADADPGAAPLSFVRYRGTVAGAGAGRTPSPGRQPHWSGRRIVVAPQSARDPDAGRAQRTAAADNRPRTAASARGTRAERSQSGRDGPAARSSAKALADAGRPSAGH